MKRLFILCLLIVQPLVVHAQGHALGFAAGQISGVGFSYRYLPDDYGVQVSFGILSTGNENNGLEPMRYTGTFDPEYPPKAVDLYPYVYNTRETHYNIGLMFFKVLHRAKRSRFYVFTGFGLFNQIEKYKERYYGYRMIDEKTYEYAPVGDEKERTERSSTRFGGVGIGMEFKVTDNIRLALEWPLTFSSKGDLIMYIPQAGLHYFFK